MYDLHTNGMPLEIEFNLDELVEKNHVYGYNNVNLKFTSFAQSPPANDITLDIFQVHFLTSNGDLYSLCPLLLRSMKLREEHFS